MLSMGEAVHAWGQEVYENSVASPTFCCETKTALKRKVLKNAGQNKDVLDEPN